MSNATLTTLQAEVQAHMDTIAPFVEGLRDAERYLNKPDEQPTRASVTAHIASLQRRLDLADTAQRALTALDADGFDWIPDLVLSADQFAVWLANHETHEAAVQRTKPEPATGADFTLSAGTDKPEA
jgi:hypothetical protein